MDTRGIDAWFDLDPRELLGAAAPDYDKVTDTMDVWMDSGMVHHCLAHEPAGDWLSRPICTWRAPTSTAAGSRVRC